MHSQNDTLRVGFAGHADWTKIADGPAVHDALKEAFIQVAAATSAGDRLVLLSGYAPGADRMAVDVWRTAVPAGRTHIVMPFLPTEPQELAEGTVGWSDDPRGGKLTTAVRDLDRFDDFTVLDGRSSLDASPVRSSHLDLARFLIAWSDVLIVVWDGAVPSGPGGTGDVVRLAISKAIPVLWIDARDGSGPWLIEPDALWPDTSFLELLDALHAERPPKASADALRTALLPAQHFPDSDGEAQGYRNWQDEWQACQHKAKPPLPDRIATRLGDDLLWQAYPMLKRLVAKPAHQPAAPDSRTVRARGPSPESAAQPGYHLISETFAVADGLANRLATAHRSQQLILLALAVTAVLVGVLAVPFKAYKLQFVAIELGILAVLFAVWRVARGRYHHRRWSDTRAYAERLRAAQATWPLGHDVGLERAEAAGSWMEWEARRLLKQIGPPTGLLTPSRYSQDIDFAEESLVRGQEQYNRSNAAAMSSFHHAVEWLEEAAFLVLVLLLATFLVLSIWMGGLPGPFGYWITVASAVLPAIGAACIAFDAKLGLDEAAERSERLAARFGSLPRGGGNVPRHARERHVREAARLLASEAASWREAAVRRKLVRGG